jgi:hypothetical protein
MWALAFRQLPAYTSLHSYTLISIWSGIYIFYNWIPARIYTELHKYLHIYIHISIYIMCLHARVDTLTRRHICFLYIFMTPSLLFYCSAASHLYFFTSTSYLPQLACTHIYIYIYLGNYKSLALRLFIYTPLRRSAQNTSMFLPC